MDIDTAGRLFPAIAGVGIALAAFALVLWLIRNRKSRIFSFQVNPSPKRLAVVETVPLDVKRRLFLVRRDNVEYLILTGGPADIVLETRDLSTSANSLTPTLPSPPAHTSSGSPASAPSEPVAQQQAPALQDAPRQAAAAQRVARPPEPPRRPAPPARVEDDDYAYGPEASALARDYDVDDHTYQPSIAVKQTTPAPQQRTPPELPVPRQTSPQGLSQESAETILEAARQRIIRETARQTQERQSRAPTTAANQRESAFSRVLEGRTKPGDLPEAQTPQVRPERAWTPPLRQTGSAAVQPRMTEQSQLAALTEEEDTVELERKVRQILEELNRRAQ